MRNGGREPLDEGISLGLATAVSTHDPFDETNKVESRQLFHAPIMPGDRSTTCASVPECHPTVLAALGP